MSQTSGMKWFMSYKDVEYIPGTFWQKTQLYLNQKFCNVQFTAYFWYTLDVLYRKWVTHAQVLNNGSVHSTNLDDLFWPWTWAISRDRRTTWFTNWNNSKLLKFQKRTLKCSKLEFSKCFCSKTVIFEKSSKMTFFLRKSFEKFKLWNFRFLFLKL